MVVVLSAAVGLTVTVTPAAAATLTVNTTYDLNGPGGGCSLREAVQAVDSPGGANGGCSPAAFGANTIVLNAGTFSLDNASLGGLSVASTVTDLTIKGAGESLTTIDANGLGDRVLKIAGGADVTISNLTITHGNAPGGTVTGGVAQPGGNGGAILNQGALTINDAAVTDSRAGGGAVGPAGVAGSQPNGGAGGVGGSGGGIFNSGQLALSGATISGNQAGNGGQGGVGSAATPSATGGNGGAGGAGGDGGGVSNVGTLTVTASTLSGNSAGAGGAGGSGGPGTGSTPGETGGAGGAGGNGGGLSSPSGSISVLNSTLASNSAGNAGSAGSPGPNNGIGGNGGTGGSGGAISMIAPAGTLQNLTVAGNDPGTGASGAAGNGTGTSGSNGVSGSTGGVLAQDTALQNSLLASNLGGNCSSSLLDGGHNLSFDGSGCPSTFAGGDPNLGPLQDNGGPTLTIGLQTGSLAIDQVPSTGANCPSVDQRGVARPQGSACDIGAYEVAAPAATTGPAQVTGKTTATLSARVTPNAGTANVTFQYGKTVLYGSETPPQTLSGVTPQDISAKLHGLHPNVTYHYRVVVTTIDGTADGVDHTFTTESAPTISSLKVTPGTITKHSGATISYRDSATARTTLTVWKGSRKLGSFSHRDKVGRNHLQFSGRVGNRALPPGSYRLVATPRAGGLTGKPLHVTFTVR
jgi:CSLREA domain-containing protein